MTFSWRGWFWVACFILLGCGNAAPPAKAPAASAPEAAAPARPIAPVDAVPDDANIVATLDYAELRAVLLDQMLNQFGSVLPPVRKALEDMEQRCGFQPWTAVKDVALFARGKNVDDELVVVLRSTVPADKALSCVAALIDADAPKDGWVVHQGVWATTYQDFVLFGAQADPVKAAIMRLREPDHRNDSAYAQSQEGMLTAHGEKLDEAVSSLDLVIGDSETAGLQRAHVVFSKAALAQRAETELRQMLKAADAEELPENVRSILGGVLDTVTIQRKNAELEISASIPESLRKDTAGQTALIGAVAALAIQGVNQYLTRAKNTEARIALNTIARRLTTHFVEQDGPRRIAKSAPRVPAEVPSGKKYQSAPTDWSGTWADIGFSMDFPQYYSYEIETAKDGKSAVIRALGDIDGDGEQAKFELGVQIKRVDGQEVLTVDPEIREENPSE